MLSKNNKWCALVTVLIFLMVLTAGCSTGTKEESNPTPNNEAKTETPKSPETSKSADKANATADFYKGKTVKFIVPFNPGGGFDSYARLVAPFLEKELGAKRVLVENIPGGGSIKGTNQFYTSEPDGLTISIVNLLGIIPAQLTGREGVKFDLNKMNWVARLASDPQVLVVSPDSKFKTFDDMLKAKSFTFAATSTTGSTYVNPVALTYGFKLNSEILTGFEGSSGTDMAVMRGDADATMASMSSKLSAIKANNLNPLLVVHKEKVSELPDVPNAIDFVRNDDEKKVVGSVSSIAAAGRSIVLPPGTPEDRIEYMRDVFIKVLDNAELKQMAEKGGMPINPLRGDKLKELVDEAMQVPDGLLQKLKGK